MMLRAERTAALLSIAAGGIHGVAAPSHFAEWWGYGVFFATAAMAQVGFGLLLWTHGIEPGPGRSWEDLRRQIYLSGIVGNLLVMTLWVVTRTVGVPAGPEAGEVEAVGVLDGISKALEVALVASLAWFWLRAAAAQRRPLP